MIYIYERDSLPVHAQRARALQREIAGMEAECRADGGPVPYWWLDRLKARRAELATVLQYDGVRECLGLPRVTRNRWGL